MNRIVAAAVVVASVAIAVPAAAQTVRVIGGQTNVALDFTTLSTAANLNFSSVSPDVISPGSLPGSVAFGINPIGAPSLPTTFAYDPSNFLGTFSGTIEHAGSVFFNADAVQVGNFTIGFSAARVGTLGGAASGFFVQSTVGVAAILFDIENPSSLTATNTELSIGANLLVSPEFGSFLVGAGLAASDLSGADVGDALVQGVVPAPGAVTLAGLALAGTLRRRRA